MSSPSIWATNHPQNGCGQDYVTHFKFWGPNDISGMDEARVIKFYVQVDYIMFKLMDNKPPLKWVWSGSQDPFSVLMPAVISPLWLKQESPNFVGG